MIHVNQKGAQNMTNEKRNPTVAYVGFPLFQELLNSLEESDLFDPLMIDTLPDDDQGKGYLLNAFRFLKLVDFDDFILIWLFYSS